MGIDVCTTDGMVFTENDSRQLAKLVLKRFVTVADATLAWNRMLQNNCSEYEFSKLIFGDNV